MTPADIELLARHGLDETRVRRASALVRVMKNPSPVHEGARAVIQAAAKCLDRALELRAIGGLSRDRAVYSKANDLEDDARRLLALVLGGPAGP